MVSTSAFRFYVFVVAIDLRHELLAITEQGSQA
jgi:hypothetical protein